MNPDSISSTPPTATPQSFEDIPPLYNTDKLVAHFNKELDRNCVVVGLSHIPDDIDFVEAFTRISQHPRVTVPFHIWSVPVELGEQFRRQLPEPCMLQQYKRELKPGIKYNRLYLVVSSNTAWLQLQPANTSHFGLV